MTFGASPLGTTAFGGAIAVVVSSPVTSTATLIAPSWHAPAHAAPLWAAPIWLVIPTV